MDVYVVLKCGDWDSTEADAARLDRHFGIRRCGGCFDLAGAMIDPGQGSKQARLGCLAEARVEE